MTGDRDMRVEKSDFEMVGQFIDDFKASHEPSLWMKLIQEEFRELLDAYIRGDDVEMFDGAIDLLYVVHGLCHSKGFNADRGFIEVHHSNMTKKWPDGSVQYDLDGKVRKGPNFQAPRLQRIIDGEWPLES